MATTAIPLSLAIWRRAPVSPAAAQSQTPQRKTAMDTKRQRGGTSRCLCVCVRVYVCVCVCAERVCVTEHLSFRSLFSLLSLLPLPSHTHTLLRPSLPWRRYTLAAPGELEGVSMTDDAFEDPSPASQLQSSQLSTQLIDDGGAAANAGSNANATPTGSANGSGRCGRASARERGRKHGLQCIRVCVCVCVCV